MLTLICSTMPRKFQSFRPQHLVHPKFAIPNVDDSKTGVLKINIRWPGWLPLHSLQTSHAAFEAGMQYVCHNLKLVVRSPLIPLGAKEMSAAGDCIDDAFDLVKRQKLRASSSKFLAFLAGGNCCSG
jgi:hypothetical protein